MDVRDQANLHQRALPLGLGTHTNEVLIDAEDDTSGEEPGPD